MPLSKDYLGIRLWGQDLGSFKSYITRQQQDAAAEGAPLDALYKKVRPGGDEGPWVCVSDLSPDHPFRARYEHALDVATVAAKEKK